MSTASASWRWDALFAAAGGLALAVQIYLLRDYLVALQGDEAAVGLGLAIWLAAIAAGAALARAVGGAHPGRGAAAALVLLASTGFAGALLARVGRSLLALPAGELLALGPALVLALLVFVLPGGCVGAGFVWLAAAATRHGTGARRAIGRLYAIEALGSLAAGLAVSLLAIPRLPPLTGLLLLLAFGLGAAVPAVLGRLIGGRWSIPVAAAVALLAARPPAAGRLEAATQRVRFASLAPGLPLLGWADTPYEHVAIGGGEIRALYAGGQYVTSFPDPDEDEPRAHQLMLLAERPRRVLALGGLETGALRFCLQHPVERLDLVQLDRGAFDLVRRHLPPADRAALADPRVRVIFEDPRRFLVRSSDRYDLVLHLQPDPATLLVARSSTVEFGRLVAARLGPGGVYAVRFSAGASVQTGATGMMGASLFRSLAAVFPVVHAAPALGGLLVAGLAPAAITLAPEPLAARYRARGLTSELFAPELLPLLFPPERAAALEGELRRAAAGVDASSDDRPVSLLYALSVRQQVARSAWATVLDWAAAHPAWLVLVFLCPGLLLLFRQLALRPARDPAAAALHATAATGACGMAWSLLLFFSFQTRV
ncbi:MAG: hypothetical protein HY744_30510, partial [Deltaproteobacteria bacterium]|nr:hypothetical protein [Deltaproteobacteria bacterium]